MKVRITIKVTRIEILLRRSLIKVWTEEQIFNDTDYIFQSGIMDCISHIHRANQHRCIEIFSEIQTLLLIFQLVMRIDSNSMYYLNFIILNLTWYQRLNMLLLYQVVDGIFSQSTIIRLEQLCQGSLSLEASQVIEDIIIEYQEAKNQMVLHQMLLIN